MASTPASQSASRTQAVTAMVCALFLGVVLYKVCSPVTIMLAFVLSSSISTFAFD
jgi:high-affinity Fe2+/Pb2+ permease